MSLTAFGLVLAAAILHASWNALVKAAQERGLVLAAVSSMHALLGLMLVLVAVPPAMASWGYILASTIIHYGYYLFLFQSYRLADLSQAYPISRGSAPVLVALGAYFAIGENLSPLAWAGLVIVSTGVCALAFWRGHKPSDPKAVMVALATGMLIAAYSVVDGIGVRASGSPFGYMGWLFLLEFPVVAVVLWCRRLAGRSFRWRSFGLGAIGGAGAVTAYGMVIYAKTIAPIGAVSAVRESSVVFAALIGLWLFGEQPWLGRLISAGMVALGVITLAFAP